MDLPLLLSTLFLFFFFTSHRAASALDSQGQALLSWRATLNGSLSDWDPADRTPCGWAGVSCNFRGEVVGIELRDLDLFGNVGSLNFSAVGSLNRLVLSGTNLTGGIPEEIGVLRELRVLDLSNNGLIGGIPDGICSLGRLERLYLQTNGLQGRIPPEIGNLTELLELMLYDNEISGEVPPSIGNLKRLQVFRVGGNKDLGGGMPPEIGNCTDLVFLGLAETSIVGVIPPEIGRLKKLETLAVYTTLLSGEIPPEIGDCVSLQNVYLYENSLTGSVPASVGNLRYLQNLLLWQNNLAGSIPPELGNCNQLVVIDMSMNSLTGVIPETVGNLTLLQELQLSTNQISGAIPSQLGNCKSLTQIELDNNEIGGGIPPELGNLPNLTLLFLWENHLEGSIPATLSNCQKLQAIDVSQNSLTGSIPGGIFHLEKLSKLLLLSNNLSGEIPPEIGNCTSLIRFRASENMLTGNLPASVGTLKNLSFLDLGSNLLSGIIPPEISGCANLTFLDLHSNGFSGNLPANLYQLSTLEFLDVSDNLIQGTLDPALGSLTSLTKLILAGNRFSGGIPNELGSLSRLQLLDLSSNQLVGPIPATLGKIPELEIVLNLSLNRLTGGIPAEFAALDKLGALDISYNELSGDLHYLSELQNLVVLNISHNNFSGHVPDTPFFDKLPLTVLSGNPHLCLSGDQCSPAGGNPRTAKLIMATLLSTAVILLLTAAYAVAAGKRRSRRAADSNSIEKDELGPPWEVTVYQKLELSIADVAKSLTNANTIGQGRSGIVYRVTISSNPTVIAVKRLLASEKSFASEIRTLGRIRHRNIVRLLGWASNGKTKLLLYDYMPNGSLGKLLHEDRGKRVDWEIRLKIAIGVGEGLSYLHHDCMPPILHRDVKSHNILLGECYEPCLADFGLASFIQDASPPCQQFAGSYGYFAPEYSSMLRITEKSDVYSFGVVLLEIITGKKPVDPSFSEGHVIQWVRDHLKSKKDPVDILDLSLQSNSDSQIQEMLQALGIALLCTSNRPEDRPTMKDVVALLKEIKHEPFGEHKKKKEEEDDDHGDRDADRKKTNSSSLVMFPYNYCSSSTSYNNYNVDGGVRVEKVSCLAAVSLDLSSHSAASLRSRLGLFDGGRISRSLRDVRSCRLIFRKATSMCMPTKKPNIPFATKTTIPSESGDLEKENPKVPDVSGGKPGFISFYGHTTRSQDEAAPFAEIENNGDFRLWFGGPTFLVASFILPSLYLRRIISTIFEDSLLTDFLILFFTESLFYCGVAVFLVTLHRLRRDSDPPSPARNRKHLDFGHRISSVMVLIPSVVVPLVTMGLVWPWTGPAASAALAPYLVGIVVQFAFEQFALRNKSACWPAIPVIFQVYRLHQLNRATQLVTALSFSVRGAEMTANNIAINGSLTTLVNVVQFLGVACIWSLSSFVTTHFSSD
ncbi:hypothetical protein M569_04970 [Genlisea aurea]|uniref:non-specific serine/threonine protein kinase n=1 Tax=Genlisea aurea TaxID=192259 RepID=S8EB57_9LAMI|nr:hypothetical protein M569_04970 [Genlisea aurea]